MGGDMGRLRRSAPVNRSRDRPDRFDAGSVGTASIPTVDYTSTARRPGWDELPAPVREAIVGRIGSVLGAVGAGSGVTPAFAATLTTASRERVFVKAADLSTEFGQSIAREAAVLLLLPPALPVPRLRWHTTVAGYAVACFDVIDGRMPGQPWTRADLALALDAIAVLADALGKPSAELVAVSDEGSFSAHCAAYVDTWRRVRDGCQPMPDAPHVAVHLSELVELETFLPQATAGATGLIHFDLRPDNILMAGGEAVVLDWNWIRPGPAWVDTVMLLVSAVGQHDCDALLRAHPTTADVPADHIDAVLAGLGGAALEASDRPPVPTSPFLRVHQRRCGLLVIDWLAHRRGWAGR